MIRAAEISDAKSISSLAKQSFFEAHETSVPKDELEVYLTEMLSPEAFTREIQNTKNVFNVLYQTDELAGYSKIIFNTAPPQLPDFVNACKLERIYLLPKYYGKNLGLKLFNFNKELCIQNNQYGIWLTVWIGNDRAIKFYEKIGFKTIGEIMFIVGKTQSPNFVMWLEL